MNEPEAYVYIYYNKDDNQPYMATEGTDDDITLLMASGIIGDARFDNAFEVAGEYFAKYGKSRN